MTVTPNSFILAPKSFKGDTVALCIIINCLDYVFKISLGLTKWFYTKKISSRRYFAETKTEANNTDDLALRNIYIYIYIYRYIYIYLYIYNSELFPGTEQSGSR